MKKRLLILAAVVVLALMLAIPASASQAHSFSFTGTDLYVTAYDLVDYKPAGNRCFVAVHVEGVQYTGDLEATGTYDYRTLSKGPCSAAQGTVEETFHVDKWFQGTLLGRYGTFTASCNGHFYIDEPARWEGHCVLKGESGELARLHGTMDWMGLLSEQGVKRSYWGEVHFD